MTCFASSALQLLKTLWLSLRLRRCAGSVALSRGMLARGSAGCFCSSCFLYKMPQVGAPGPGKSRGSHPMCVSRWLTCFVAPSLPSFSPTSISGLSAKSSSAQTLPSATWMGCDRSGDLEVSLTLDGIWGALVMAFCSQLIAEVSRPQSLYSGLKSVPQIPRKSSLSSSLEVPCRSCDLGITLQG